MSLESERRRAGDLGRLEEEFLRVQNNPLEAQRALDRMIEFVNVPEASTEECFHVGQLVDRYGTEAQKQMLVESQRALHPHARAKAA